MKNKISQFEGEKMRYEARKRDFQRSKLPEGRRIEAMETGRQITAEHSKLKEKNEASDEFEFRDGMYDRAIRRAYDNTKKSMEIRRLII